METKYSKYKIFFQNYILNIVVIITLFLLLIDILGYTETLTYAKFNNLTTPVITAITAFYLYKSLKATNISIETSERHNESSIIISKTSLLENRLFEIQNSFNKLSYETTNYEAQTGKSKYYGLEATEYFVYDLKECFQKKNIFYDTDSNFNLSFEDLIDGKFLYKFYDLQEEYIKLVEELIFLEQILNMNPKLFKFT